MRASLLPAIAVLAAVSMVGPAARAAAEISEAECFNALNELAASAVFSDLPEEEMEKAYGHLDTLQDACGEKQFETAAKAIEELEKLLGK